MRGGDDWTTDEKKITDDLIKALVQTHDEESALIVEHSFYRGSRAPYRFVTASSEELEQYLRTKVHPGDLIYVWKFEDCCRDDNAFANGKIPDELGRVPRGGAY